MPFDDFFFSFKEKKKISFFFFLKKKEKKYYCYTKVGGERMYQSKTVKAHSFAAGFVFVMLLILIHGSAKKFSMRDSVCCDVLKMVMVVCIFTDAMCWFICVGFFVLKVVGFVLLEDMARESSFLIELFSMLSIFLYIETKRFYSKKPKEMV